MTGSTSCSALGRQLSEVCRVRRRSAERRVRPPGIVESEVAGQLLPGLGDALVGMEVDVLIFHALPQAFDKYIIDPAPLAIHAYLDLVGLQHLGEVVTGELAPLVGVEDLWRAVLGDGFFERLDAEIRGHADGDPVRQDPSSGPVG